MGAPVERTTPTLPLKLGTSIFYNGCTPATTIGTTREFARRLQKAGTWAFFSRPDLTGWTGIAVHAAVLQQVGTWTLYSGRARMAATGISKPVLRQPVQVFSMRESVHGLTAAPGMAVSVRKQQAKGSSMFCNGHAVTTAPGTKLLAPVLLRQVGWILFSGRGQAAAPGIIIRT